MKLTSASRLFVLSLSAIGLASHVEAQRYTMVELPAGSFFAPGAYHPMSQATDSSGGRYAYAVTMTNGAGSTRHKVTVSTTGIQLSNSALARPKGTTAATGYAVNALGQVSGKAFKASTSYFDGFVCFWNTPTTPTMLDRQESNCINDNGIVGAWLNTQKIHGPALWNSTTKKWTAIGGNWPYEINNAGYVVGSSSVVSPTGSVTTFEGQNGGISASGLIAGGFMGKAVLRTPSVGGYVTTELAPYPSGIIRDGYEFPISTGWDVNDQGTVVGFCYRDYDENGVTQRQHRALLFESGTYTLLEDLVDTNGAQLSVALAINEAGWIACRGIRNGTEIAVVLIPN